MKDVFATLKRWWLAFARALGWVNTRVLLTIVYALLIGIPSIVLRLFRKDLLGRKMDGASYWVTKEPAANSLEQAKHQF